MFIPRSPEIADPSATPDADSAGLRQEAPGLTTVLSATLPPTGHPLPAYITGSIASGHCSAVRAWRAHRGLSWHDVAHDSKLNASTLRAIDCGFVDLCEWTVAPVAQALGVDAGQLLQAQHLAMRIAEDDLEAESLARRASR